MFSPTAKAFQKMIASNDSVQGNEAEPAVDNLPKGAVLPDRKIVTSFLNYFIYENIALDGNASMQKIKENLALIITSVTTIIYLYLALHFFFNFKDFIDLKLSEKGDFLAGVFSPLAFLWLVFGYYQQGQELKQNTEALRLQADELSESVKQQTELVNVAKSELDQTIQQISLSTHQKLIDSQPYFHIFDLYINRKSVPSLGENFFDFDISFKLKNSRALCRSVFFTISYEENGADILLNGTTFDVLDYNLEKLNAIQLNTGFPKPIMELEQNTLYLRIYYTDSYDKLQIQVFKIEFGMKNFDGTEKSFIQKIPQTYY
ncbi:MULTISPECIES: hypothetical protein [unclassified Acinetobacter]|uniref:hypothetical protein n=1 Tax=unclassified Acinetobacter TaxID=196816 RepID=UPI00190DFA80|nr:MULTISPECIES: hypothetical protein [unclassified Acinetobacter]MBK0063955.1 hypothetical protein [Acinetobacter sp. S55]MBK0067240.1 hypothetical protein [Acinetobacter sp. S54]